MNTPNKLNKTASLLFVIALSVATATATTNVIFSLEEDEGEYADTDLEVDHGGNIYGTTVLGGDFGGGTVFQLSPTPNGWVHNVLYSFTGGADGGEPYKGVTIDRDGNLYGSAVTGGSGSCEGGCGVVYKLSNSGGTWTQTVIHAFTGGNDGSGPGEGNSGWCRKHLWNDSDQRRLRPGYDLQNPSDVTWVLDVEGHSRFYRRLGRGHRLGWKDAFAQ